VSRNFYYFGLYLGLGLGGTAQWGEFGDFVGGLTNPVVGLVAVILVARTLWTTRLEAKETRDLLMKQVDHFERRERLQELRQRLEGVLLEWNAALEQPLRQLMKYKKGKDGTEMHNYEDKTARTIFYLPGTLSHYRDEAHDLGRQAVLLHWNSRFGNFVQLLDELDEYCSEYDSFSRSRDVSNFYRRRVQYPLQLFRAVGMIGDTDLTRLNISFPQRAYAESLPSVMN